MTLVITPKDGKQLAGKLGIAGSAIDLSGWSQKIRFKERGTTPVHFGLAFPSPRKISLSWYVEDRIPASKAVTTTTSVSGTDVVAVYGFAQDHAVQNDLTLALPSSAFTDGNALSGSPRRRADRSAPGYES